MCASLVSYRHNNISHRIHVLLFLSVVAHERAQQQQIDENRRDIWKCVWNAVRLKWIISSNNKFVFFLCTFLMSWNTHHTVHCASQKQRNTALTLAHAQTIRMCFSFYPLCFTETKKHSPNTGARANNTHVLLFYPLCFTETKKHSPNTGARANNTHVLLFLPIVLHRNKETQP